MITIKHFKAKKIKIKLLFLGLTGHTEETY